MQNNGFYATASGHIKMSQTTRFEIGGNLGSSSFIGLRNLYTWNTDTYGIYINNCDHEGDYTLKSQSFGNRYFK